MSWKLNAAFAAAAALAFGASASACPQVRVIKHTGAWVVSNANGAEVLAEISDPEIQCAIKGDKATATVKFTMTGMADVDKAPVFVAVANMRTGTPVFTSKEVYNKSVSRGPTEVVFDEVTIPLNASGLTTDYQVLVGFQLTNEQLAAERKRNSWFSWLF
jgi:hypothetical protein